MGYEIAVTPLQLAAAYVAIANGGELLEPALVKEVRAPDGRVLYRHERRVVRRVLSADVARRMRAMLLSVVADSGTAIEGGARDVHARRQDRHGAAHGAWTLRGVAAHPDVRRALSRRRAAVRHPREARQPEGRVLRRPHGRAR